MLREALEEAKQRREAEMEMARSLMQEQQQQQQQAGGDPLGVDGSPKSARRATVSGYMRKSTARTLSSLSNVVSRFSGRENSLSSVVGGGGALAIASALSEGSDGPPQPESEDGVLDDGVTSDRQGAPPSAPSVHSVASSDDQP